MDETTKRLVELAKNTSMSDEQREKQRRSFAFGNSNIENDNITRDSIDKEADTIRTTRGRRNDVE